MKTDITASINVGLNSEDIINLLVVDKKKQLQETNKELYKEVEKLETDYKKLTSIFQTEIGEIVQNSLNPTFDFEYFNNQIKLLNKDMYLEIQTEINYDTKSYKFDVLLYLGKTKNFHYLVSNKDLLIPRNKYAQIDAIVALTSKLSELRIEIAKNNTTISKTQELKDEMRAEHTRRILANSGASIEDIKLLQIEKK